MFDRNDPEGREPYAIPMDERRTSTFPIDRDIARISAKSRDIVLDPLKPCDTIMDP